MLLKRPVAGGESCKQDSFLILSFKFQNPEKFIMKKTANKCSKNSSIFEMGMLLYIKRKRIYVRKICSDIIDQRIRAIFICLT